MGHGWTEVSRKLDYRGNPELRWFREATKNLAILET